MLLPETPVLSANGPNIDTGALSLDELPAKSVATRLCRTIEGVSIKTEKGETVSVTVSLGVAEKTDEITDIERLIDCADQALLEAKQRGRNQVIIWDLA